MKRNVAIYGAGTYGRRLLQLLRRAGIEPCCFVQTGKGDQRAKWGLEIISIDDLLKIEERPILLLAIGDWKSRAQVRGLLEENHYDMALVYDMASFIAENEAEQGFSLDGGEKRCIFCGCEVDEFLPAGEKYPIFKEKKIIGGGYRKNVICPCCGSGDRARWVYWVLRSETDIFSRECTVIHIAPERQLKDIFEHSGNCDYYPGDIAWKPGIHKIDVTDIPYADRMADFVIINHVMEHVRDEAKAIRELTRVMKDDGTLVMSFPIAVGQKTIEDDQIDSDEGRIRHYGQKDHVRLYGNDFKERFEKYGLKIKVASPKDCVTDEEIARYGFIRDDVLLLCTKQNGNERS